MRTVETNHGWRAGSRLDNSKSRDANRIVQDLAYLGQQKRKEIVEWLRERRDIAAHRGTA
jgi:hypothetical protein